ncbi:DHA2 family efflux MFS transporter permease subunit [Noviherbaspirillum sp. Root189]|uniref:DHA2 family efflux MFS transporter permease subunit n=1 Tax=Noviherbaspirillum sp. Root189 TaxID=1736487 RepID=UPI00070E20C3|nr:DHA2 family efflux MFS transporter permease subunit [Noviherbaspirillum sp. Root189]KRB78909.1 MFS transporter [Noviherbaspirillum sp. Root189]
MILGTASTADAPCAVQARPMVLAATIFASSMAFIDGTVVNVALPALMHEFTANAGQVQWVIESYALFLAALLLAGGSAGDRYGRRRVFLTGVMLFAAASVWCSMAANIHQLIIARAAQGVGGALLVPGSLALITASFPTDVRGKAIGTWSGYTAITAALGPVMGGFLIEHWSWRAAFLVNIPLTLVVLLLTLRYVPESRGRGTGPLDWLGAALASTGLGFLVFGLILSSTIGWLNSRVIGSLLLAAIASAAFVLQERRHPAPLVSLKLFRSRDFAGANLLTFLLYAALGGSLYFLPLNLIQVQGYTALQAGAALLPMILTMFLLSRWAGTLVDRYGAKKPLMIGPVIVALGFGLFALPAIGGSYWLMFFPAVMLLGLGMAISVAPLTTTVMNALDGSLAGAASGINNAVSRLAALLAIAFFGIVMSLAFRYALAGLDHKVSPMVSSAVFAQWDRLAGIDVPVMATREEHMAVKSSVGNAFIYGFRWIMLLSAALALASSFSAWRLIGRPEQPQAK